MVRAPVIAAVVLLATSGCGDPGPLPTSTTPVAPGSPTAAEPRTVGALAFDAAPRNLLFVSIDTLRADSVFRPGDADSLTPFLDTLATEGVRATDAVGCSSWTAAAVACVLSGATNLERAPARGMVPILYPNDILEPLPGEGHPMGPTPLLAGWLAEAGFTTVLSSGNHFMGARAGTDQGYQVAEVSTQTTAATLVDRGIDLLAAEQATGPWFLHLHLMEPHRPYDPPQAYLGEVDQLDPIPFDLADDQEHSRATKAWNDMEPEDRALLEAHFVARYRAEVRWLDDQLRDAWARLDAAGLLDDTLVVVWTDHGEAFWEHGVQAHSKSVFSHENDIALLFWSRGLAAGRVDGPVFSTDVVPTVLEVFDVPTPETVTGHVLGTAPDDRVRSGLVVGGRGTSQMVLVGGRKLHHRWTMPNDDGRPAVEGGAGPSLFDRGADPDELVDLYDPAHPDTHTLALWSELAPRIAAAEPWVAADPRGAEPDWPQELPR